MNRLHFLRPLIGLIALVCGILSIILLIMLAEAEIQWYLLFQGIIAVCTAIFLLIMAIGILYFIGYGVLEVLGKNE